MRLSNLLSVVVVCAVVPSVFSAPPDLKGKTLKQTFDALLPGMASGKNDAQQQWQDLCFAFGAPGNEALRIEACKLMADNLGNATPKPARLWLLKQLERIGRDECIDIVAAVLADKDDVVRDAAVRCMANNPSPKATTPLLAALPKSTGKARVGLLNALGQRGDRAATDALVRELQGEDSAAIIAAARALGRLGTLDASIALATARRKFKGEVHLAVSDAYLLCADRRLQEGKVADAAAIYRKLNRAEEPEPIRLAALLGVLKTSGDEAGDLILKILGGPDAGARAIAVSQIEHVSAAALKPLAAHLDNLPPASQALVLHSLAGRGERSQLPAVLAAVKSPHEAVRRAGVQALGRLGDVSVIPLLLTTVYAGNDLGGLAADSLTRLTAEGADEKLIGALESEKTADHMRALIDILERRKTVSAIPAILKAAQDDRAAVRTSAFAGLRTLAEPKHVPAMVRALLKTEKGKERELAEQAIAAVCARVSDPAKRADPVLALLKDELKEHQVALLPLVGRLGGAEALRQIKDALRDGGSEQYEAALTALCNWPDPSASEELLALAKDSKDARHRLRALQALIRVNAVLSDLPTEPRLATLKKAMELTTRVQERKALLEGIGFVRHLETLRYVLPYLDDKDFNQSACKAVVELAHSRMLREPNKAEFDKALDRVIALCMDKTLVERARQYKQAP
jgi:HEAT repeat protein